MSRRRVRRVLVALLVALAALTGCVQVPTRGPIEKVEGQPEACQSCINVEVAPPTAGDEPRLIVEGYLRATSNYQPNYSIAKQFLTKSAADTWAPEAGVSIYRDPLLAGDTNVTLDGQLVGSLGKDRTYTAQDRRRRWDFKLVREDGEWRISRPPPGLMVAEFSFTRFYTGYSLYFVGNGTSLVPERIYLPALGNPANVASALMTALLDGPSDWLDPAVESSLPMETSLSVDSVPITNGIAEVALNDAVLALPDPQRALAAAQIVYTLRQASGVKGVLITADQQRFRVPESDPTSLVIPVDAFSREIEPVPIVSDQLYAVREGRVHTVTTSGETPAVVPVTGDLAGYPVSSLAVSVNGTDLAVVTDDRTVLRRAETASGDVTLLKSGLAEVLRPQFTRYGEVWTIGRQDGRQRLWVAVGEEVVAVDAPVLDKAEVTAFRISPDGARIALVRRTDSGHELGLARIARADKITVDDWRRVDVTQSESPQVTVIHDVAWLDANDLLLLGARTDEAVTVPVRVAADASRITAERGVADWDAQQFSVLTRPQTVVAVGASRKTWRDDGGEWLPLPFLEDVSAVAYAG